MKVTRPHLFTNFREPLGQRVFHALRRAKQFVRAMKAKVHP